MRRPLSFRVVALLALVPVLLAGCGDQDAEDSKENTAGSRSTTAPAQVVGEPEPTDGAEASEQAQAMLEVKLDNVGGKQADAGIPVPSAISCDKRLPASCSGQIACPAPEGDRFEAVCRWLATAEGAATITTTGSTGRLCTEQYGGPEVATVTGILAGRPVDASFTRTDGCEISRFDAAAPLWTAEVPAADTPADPVPQPDVIDDPPEAFGR